MNRHESSSGQRLPRGIVAVVQTAFQADGRVDLASMERLVEAAILGGANGLLVPVVASEVDFLSAQERREIVTAVSAQAADRVPIILGASAGSPVECAGHAALAQELGLASCLVAVPQSLYGNGAEIDGFFGELAALINLQVVVQDLQFNGPGLTVEEIQRLRQRLPQLAGMKIETVPAGPKYTAVREACGANFWIAGGWAVTQMIEALDRGVDAMVPESSMVATYVAIARLHRCEREAAVELFRRLLPVLAFTNQDLATSVAFFKRLLVRKDIFSTARQRLPLRDWDRTTDRIAGELIEEYIALEARCAADGSLSSLG